jgi:hypothetical protein
MGAKEEGDDERGDQVLINEASTVQVRERGAVSPPKAPTAFLFDAHVYILPRRCEKS